MANKNAKAIAQASKVSKNTATATAKAAAPKSKIELFGAALVNFVRSNFACVEHKEGSHDYFLRGVDLGNGVKIDYRLSIAEAPAKEGKRASHKRELYRIDAEGKERLVQFGTFKKKYLYPLMGMVVAGKPSKVSKMVIDKELTGKIADAIRADRKSFKLADGVLSGKVKDVGSFRMVETTKTLKNGKTQLVRQLFIDGVLKLEGGQLGKIKNAFTKVGAHRTMKDILADANDAVADLI